MTTKPKSSDTPRTTAINHWEYADGAVMRQAKIDYTFAFERAKRHMEQLSDIPARKLPPGYKIFMLEQYTKFKQRAFTKTDKTKRAYSKRATSLVQRYESDPAMNIRNSATSFFMWLMIRKQVIADNTWKVDRAALLHYLNYTNTLFLHELVRNTDNKGGKAMNKKRVGLEKKTSEKKLKHITEEDMSKSLHYFKHADIGYWDNVAIGIFIISYFTGIRPIEITQSSVIYIYNDDGELVPALRVKNAKNTNGRGNRKYRTIPLDRAEGLSIEEVRRFVEAASFPKLANGKPTTPEKYEKYASAAFGKHMRKIFPRRKYHITLYTARHQFAADAKRSGMIAAELAALLGHATDRTAHIHYAKPSRSTSTKRMPKAIQSEVATVRNKLSMAFITQQRCQKSCTPSPSVS